MTDRLTPAGAERAPTTASNHAPILKVPGPALPQPGLVLEIGSGTGKHAVYFAEHLPGLV